MKKIFIYFFILILATIGIGSYLFFNQQKEISENTKAKTKAYEKTSQKFSIVMPIIPRDFYKLKSNLKFIDKFITYDKVVLIGPESVQELINENLGQNKVTFINENSLIDTVKVKETIKNKDEKFLQRSGWYIQQFIKMEYSKISDNEYYLVWDSDTIPVKKLSMFNEDNTPFFDIKTEYHKPYFETIQNLFPDLFKIYNFSFISEHMIIKRELMQELISKIQERSDISGNLWYEKVINAVRNENFECGFSEFETYGTYVMYYHPEYYKIRKWESLRSGSKSYKFDNLSDEDIETIAEKYDAISFEEWT